MRLKRLELAGFKSFVDPTRIDLDQGITAIVGPNGCGKSNIVDALRWVLGEHSARHLRGGVMDDLIFQGSDSRAPVAICDVELSFSTSPGTLPAPYHDLSEIRIRRRLIRDGGSDAFINGKMVRMKDIIDLFLDTGISTRAYAIVEQGSIARMVTARADERRIIFEEAAGVMKYRSRRKEAERRMQDTRSNLERVLDLLDEVRSQCRSLKQQASRAERFRQMQGEFSHLQALSLGLRYQSLQQQISASEQQRQHAAQGEHTLAAQLSHAEADVNSARQQLSEYEQDIQAAQDALRNSEQQRAELQQQAERMAGERRLLGERQDSLLNRITEQQQRYRQLEHDQAGIRTQLSEQDDAALQAQCSSAQQTLQDAQQRYHQHRDKRDKLLSDFEGLRLCREQALQQRLQAEQSLTRLDERDEQLHTHIQQLDALQRTQQKALQADTQQLATAKQQQADSEQALQTAQQHLQQQRREREAMLQDLKQQESSLRERSGVVQELRGRSQNHDVSDALRHSIRAAGGIWMDESLHVPEGLEAAVAAALRGRAGNICMPTNNPDLSSILKQIEHSAIALFIPPDQQQPCQMAANALSTAMGLDDKHPLYRVFASVQLVDDITRCANTGNCCVSRNGWRREADGWLIPPAGNRTAKRLAIQRTLRQHSNELQQQESALAQLRQQFTGAEQSLDAQQQRWQQAHLQATESESRSRALAASRNRTALELESLQQQQQRLHDEVADIARERQRCLAQLEQSVSIDRTALVQAERTLQQQNQRLEQVEQALEQARQLCAQSEQSLALFAQARANLQQQSQRLEQDKQQLAQQLDADTTRLDQTRQALQQSSSRQALQQQLTEAVAAVEAAHQHMHTMREHGHTLQQALHQHELYERQLRQQLQQAATARQHIELQQTQHHTRLQDLETEIEQRCQRSVPGILQLLDEAGDAIDSSAVQQQAGELEARLARFGPVNLLAIDEYEQASEREGFLAAQAADLESSLTTLSDTIGRIDRTTRQRFQAVFDQTNAYFKQTFPQLFGGGRAELRLDSEDVLTAGVEVIAQPPGKRLQDVGLLSGGEKALTAVALVFSIFKIKPAPFCVLDEVDAPLDDANVGRFADMVRELSDQVQFLSITHNKVTMQKADRLIGVSMPEPGVSKIIAVDLQTID